jgi:hypothetical protein
VISPDPGILREPRDVALRLADLLHERDRPHPVIIFAELLANAHPDLAADLRDWATAEATRQHSREALLAWRGGSMKTAPQAGTAADPMSVVIQLEPSDHAPDQYVYTIWRHGEDVVLVERENTPLGLPEIIGRLKGKLPAELGQLSGDQVIVEFILPPALFDEPVHLWPVFRNPYVLLGYRYPVVIRDWERFYEAEDRNHAKIKWNWLSEQATTPLHWLGCVDKRTADAMYPWFEEKIERAALGMPGPPSGYDGVLGAALDAGVRVAFWRLNPCNAHNGTGGNRNNGPCDGMIFCQTAGRRVTPESVNALPVTIKQLRLSPGTLSDTALLWDNPHRGPHPRGLAVE